MRIKLMLAALLASTMAGQAFAADSLKLAIGQRGNWDTAVAELGQRGGIFKKHDLELDLLYTQGGGETLQAVISGSADIGVAAGTLGVLGAFSKGAPVRIIGAQATGAADFWYVPASSKIQSIKDAGPDTTIAYSTNGSSTNSMALGFVQQYGLKSKLVATGSPSATFTPTMTGQVDIGWSSPPFGFDALDQGKIRIVARGNDVESIRNQSIRTLIGNAQFVDQHKDELDRFMAAYRETVDWMYSSDEALKIYADFAGTDEKTARRIRDEFFPKSLIDPDEMKGLDQIMADAVTYKTLSQPLSDDQLKTLIQIPPRQ
ncbi:ABC transporter substrate-binding protein [Mangrovibrevibacter kandeliae]|uniref:ABC transporter substrate-binding protein n=1 Tax=Mangrovibrevibacter kandeliae TaxID=2968473 RepID=UPI0021197EBB|nr:MULTISPECIES: ABC transporter substrate-binding protein [unclassified Aurantimonas]MCQ8783063.1 ABC transporter substrate-binding protein [Aurantimonas sp. CSK15Z-1]MCW4115747.1 ABC transporter substrate-binding protein [Aurantimonas sp. MSK8Z-1]